MAKWVKTIAFRDFITGDTSPAGVAYTAKQMMAVLATTNAPTMALAEAQKRADAGDEYSWLLLDHALDRIYDWADANRVWID